MKKSVTFLMIFLIILIVMIFIGKNLIAKTAISGGVMAITGLQMDIDKMDVGIIKTVIDINEMKLYNPPDFMDRVMIDMPDIYVDYNLGAFIGGKAHLEEVRIDLKELTVIKNKEGQLNIESLNISKSEEKAEKPKEEKKTDIRIDILELKIGKVAYKDFSRGGVAIKKEYNVNLHETFQNVTDLNEMGRLILVRALMNTNIANLANFDLGSLKSGISETLMKATDLAKPVEEIGEKTGEALKDAAKDIKDKFKLPFGK